MVTYLPDRITGPRLVLRPPVLDDAGALFQRVARDPEVTRYLLWAPHRDVAVTRRVITEKLNVSDDERTWVIELRHSGEVIGLTSCRRPVAHSVEIGYCLGRRWWGKGFMSEVLDMLLAALQADRDVYRAWATCSVDNERSARLLERAGFYLEGRLARHAVYPTMGPEPRDSLLYAKALR
ncbi:GNAT family N-acetyltransferase [Mycobacterium malmoense]|uniref:GNAT family N-acetyltransferase n=1 Tax=Mycobacterium malmoense TaxID=1780 RepID=A0ABX3SQM7_MYCMA|nr:GNAT family N-acetyltransferase [Mycobacterium malmoense]OIN78559.1 GNAT family N-acetyltransferase [Mycobacterium malmoense]ORA81694.1 GNAT family N-acetyltransferase [Mycobacterium malmoense]QZA19399.1 GNAT family N-acetyltransferase [Mycobacterium malmoense]UNB96152.1 GNAT family N-acetyltransferase [Mycobacterium malmoense]